MREYNIRDRRVRAKDRLVWGMKRHRNEWLKDKTKDGRESHKLNQSESLTKTCWDNGSRETPVARVNWFDLCGEAVLL